MIKLTTSESYWHCMSLVLGLGTLSMPYVFKQLGWSAIPILAFFAYVSAHTAKLLCKCIEYENPDNLKSNKKLMTYSDIGRAAFGTIGYRSVMAILYVDLVASSALFLIFIANNVEYLLQGVLILNKSQWILLVAILVFPTIHLKLHKLSALSKLGTRIIFFLVLCVVVTAFITDASAIKTNKYDLYNKDISAIGNIIFAFSCHGTLLTLYRQMKTPENVNKLFDQVYASGFFLKVLVGSVGYYIFAQATTDQISLNLTSNFLKVSVTILVTLKKWVTYALPLEPIAQDFTRYALHTAGKKAEKQIFLVRSSLVMITAGIALFLPYFGMFQGIVGVFCASFLVLIFPIVFFIKLYGKKISRVSYFGHIFLLAIIIVTLIVSALHTYQTLKTFNS